MSLRHPFDRLSVLDDMADARWADELPGRPVRRGRPNPLASDWWGPWDWWHDRKESTQHEDAQGRGPTQAAFRTALRAVARLRHGPRRNARPRNGFDTAPAKKKR